MNLAFSLRFNQKSVKELIAVLLGFAICWIWKFDAFSFIIPLEKTTIVGYALSGAIIAGGSKASIKLFHDLLKVRSTVVADREEDKVIRKEQEANLKWFVCTRGLSLFSLWNRPQQTPMIYSA